MKSFNLSMQPIKISQRSLLVIGGILVFSVLGSLLLNSSNATTPTTSLQAETGSLAGNTNTLSDSSASGGSAVKFGATQVTGNCISGNLNDPGTIDPWGGCWPGPQNTGYPHGLLGDTRTAVGTLTNYTGPQEIKSCGIVIDRQITSWLVIHAGNGTHNPDTPCVTIKNSLVMGTIFSDDPSNGPVVITDTEINSDGDLPYAENAGRYNYFVTRVNSHGGEGVIKCAAYCTAQDNWVHGMTLGGSYHYNAVGGNGMEAGSFLINHNWLSCGDWESVQPGYTSDAGCSAVIGFYGDYDPLRNITINRNHLKSTFDMSASMINYQAGYCLNPGYYTGKPYPDPTNMTITNNIFGRGGSGKCGVFGPTNSLNRIGQGGTNVWSGNQYDDGTAINRVEE